MDATIHIRIDQVLKDDLDHYAKASGVKLSSVVRMALEEYSEKEYKPTTSKINPDKF
jgi:antitoxin component of RelBE/YafQ-DinJ toxin-antitoxin module